MTTLISYGNSEGTRRCDARCYSASAPDCDCICGGMNHGKGFDAAAQNTADHGRAMVEAVAAKKGVTVEELLPGFEFRPVQRELLA